MCSCVSFFGIFLCCAVSANAQLSFSSAISLAVRNSSQIKLAQDDLAHAQAGLSETKDAFIPRVYAGGGAGRSYGITLNVPTIFTVDARSLVYSSAQKAYLRAGRIDVQASSLALAEAVTAVEEDAAITYVLLDHMERLSAALAEQFAASARLVTIVEDRHKAGLESDEDVRQTRRSSLEIRLHAMQTEDERSRLRLHLAGLIGIPGTEIVTSGDSIPTFSSETGANELKRNTYPDSPALLAAEAGAAARQERVLGDSRYNYRPQISFAAQYGRVSPINDVSDYYNLRGNYNTAAFGLLLQFPLLDRAHEARVRQQAADAQHARHDAERLRIQENDDRLALRNTLSELAIKASLAEIDHDSASDQLKATLIEVTSGGYSGPPKTPKDEQRARIHERQTYLDLLDAQVQLHKSQIFLLRKTGDLARWATSGERLSSAN